MKGICFFFRAAKPLEKGKGETTMTNTNNHETWAQLLHSAIHTPGKLLAAYTAFHNYSFGNALLALTQCRRRNLEPGPLNTYRGWLELKRQVRKGEKGITLCMPMQYKKRVPKDNEQEEESEETTRSTFGFRAYWFVLAQTDGDAMETAPIPGFDLDTALRTLNITRTEFDEMNGNIQGFAIGREIAISPIAGIPHKTTFHEIAHCVLGHTTREKLVDSEATPINLREVEAEAVALICCETLSLDGAEYARGYIQHWLQGEKEIPNHNAARVFTAASTILKAGNPAAGSQ
jgi:antirestriction protein ArdC